MLPIWLDSWPPFPGGDASFYARRLAIAPAIRALKQDVVGNVGNVLWVVMGTIGVVLLIACANVDESPARARRAPAARARGARRARSRRVAHRPRAVARERAARARRRRRSAWASRMARWRSSTAIGADDACRVSTRSRSIRARSRSRSPSRSLPVSLLGLVPALEARRPGDHRRAAAAADAAATAANVIAHRTCSSSRKSRSRSCCS